MPTANQTPRDDWTILAVLQWTAAYFDTHGIDSPRTTAELLLAHTLDISRIDLYLRFDQPLSAEERNSYKQLIRRRIQREPVAYIIGEKEFWALPITVNNHVLIPRPETECLVEQALSDLPESGSGTPWRILELGTGSGAIITALAVHRGCHQFTALDISQPALAVTRSNLARHASTTDVDLCCADLFAPFNPTHAQFDMIVSNPPYIPEAEIEGLQPEINRYEPRVALCGGKSGREILEKIVRTVPDHLKSGGILLLEIGYDQFDAIKTYASGREQFRDITVLQDLSGLDRVVRMVKN